MISSNEVGSATSHVDQTAHSLQSFESMDLPRKLRNHIYSCLVESRRSLADLTSPPSDWFNPNILLTNRQIEVKRRRSFEQKISILVEPLGESNFLTSSTKVLEGLSFKRCGMEIDLSGADDKEIYVEADSSTVGVLKGAVMPRSVFYHLVNQLNRMPVLKELHFWNPGRTVSTDECLRQQTEDSGVDEESEMDVDNEAGSNEDPAEDEALSLEKLRQRDDAVFLENTVDCFQQLADTINVTIEGNLSLEDFKRIVSLIDRPDFLW